MSYQKAIDRDVRLIILKALAAEEDYELNSTILKLILEDFGHKKTREYIHNQLRWLETNVGAVTNRDAGTIIVAKLTRAGLDHVEMRSTLEGVDRPSLEG